MTEYQMIYWQDVPVHVRMRQGRERASQLLPERFQAAAKRGACWGRAITGEADMAAWKSTPWQNHTATFDETLATIVAAVEADYPPELLVHLIDSNGFRASDKDDS